MLTTLLRKADPGIALDQKRGRRTEEWPPYFSADRTSRIPIVFEIPSCGIRLLIPLQHIAFASFSHSKLKKLIPGARGRGETSVTITSENH